MTLRKTVGRAAWEEKKEKKKKQKWKQAILGFMRVRGELVGLGWLREKLRIWPMAGL
jgi:hypothetical protein